MTKFFRHLFFFGAVLGFSISAWAQYTVSVAGLEKPFSENASFFTSPADSAGQGVDILHYDVHLEPNFETGFLQGECRISLRITASLPKNRLYFNLQDLQVDSALVGETRLPFFVRNSYLILLLSDGISAADTFSVRIFYHGFPTNDGFGGYFSSPKIVYTVGEGLFTQPPSMTHRWLPCVDRPDDKATLAMHVRVPQGISVGSNGVQQKAVPLGDALQEVGWREDFPIATYLFSIGAARFVRFKQIYVTTKGDSIPIEYFIFPEDSLIARADVQNLPDMLEFFSEKFGPYPFKKYGMLEAPMQGAMEHQTLTTISDRLITGDRRYEGVVAHELAHQWWGDCVTLSDWGEIWLNEGFATYSDALYTEHAYGEKAFRKKMHQFAFLYFREDEQVGRFPIVNPRKMWGHTVYEKGAWVLHMLRGVVGDARFFEILRGYRRAHAYKNATIADFQSVAETVYGSALDWFFHEWLFEAGYPTYTFQWESRPLPDGPVSVRVQIRQIQTLAPLFKMPVTLRFEFADSTTDRVIWVEHAETDRRFTFEVGPQQVKFDPDGFVLKKLINYSETVTQAVFGLQPPFPNPFRPASTAEGVKIFFWSRPSGEPIELEIFDSRGRRVRRLLGGKRPPGVGRIVWDGRNNRGRLVAGGLYFCSLRQGDQRSVKKILVLR